MRKKSGRKSRSRKDARVQRKVVTRSGSGTRFIYASRKSNRSIKCESGLEFSSNDRHEFDRNITSYSEHQSEETIESIGRSFVAFPDTQRFTRDGFYEVVEVKREAMLSHPESKARLEDIRRHYAKDDVPYLVWTEREIHKDNVHYQLEELREFRKPGERRRLLEMPEVSAALASPLPESLEGLAELLGGWKLVKGLLANDILVVNIADPFGPSQPVQLH